MKLIFIVLIWLPVVSAAQNNFTVIIKNETTKAPVPGATLKTNFSRLYFISDSMGAIRLVNIANGRIDIEITCIGYKEMEKAFIIPLATDSIIIYMEPAGQELEEVTVSATRSNRSIRNTPTRVEVIAEEEVREEATHYAAR